MNARRIRLMAVWSLWIGVVVGLVLPTLAQEGRQLRVSITDARQQPIDRAEVAVGLATLHDCLSDLVLAGSPQGRAGERAIDFAKLPEPWTSQLYTLCCWSEGYELRIVSAAQSAAVELEKASPKLIFLQDATGAKIVGARVELYGFADDRSGKSFALPHSWREKLSAVTDELGACELPSWFTDGAPILSILRQGLPEQRILLPVRGNDNSSGPLVIKPSQATSLRGQLSSFVAGAWEVWLEPINNLSLSSGGTVRAVSSPRIAIAQDGSFEFASVTPGQYWLKFASSVETSAKERPPLAMLIEMNADSPQQISVPVRRLAEISGKVISDVANADYSDVDVHLYCGESQVRNSGSPETRLLTKQVFVASARCDLTGGYHFLVTPGEYLVSRCTSRQWVSLKPQAMNAAVGPGAATLAVGDMELHKADLVRIDISNKLLEELGIDPTKTSLSVRSVQAGSIGTFGAMLGADCENSLLLPSTADPQYWHVNMSGAFARSVRMRDSDPSRNIALSIDRESGGLEGNTQLSVQVTDRKGMGLPGVRLRITFSTAETRAASSQADGSSPASSRLRVSNRVLADSIMTDASGFVRLRDFQAISSLMGIVGSTSSRATAMKLTFEASTLGTFESKTVSRTVEVNNDKPRIPGLIELDDIVIDTPPTVRSVGGRMVTDLGIPIRAQTVWLLEFPGLRRTVTDRNGAFQFDATRDDCWLLVENGWNAYRVSDLADHSEFRTTQSLNPVQPQVAKWERMSLADRRKLAEAQTKRMDGGQQNPLLGLGRGMPILFGPFGNPPLAKEAYLDPDEYFKILSARRDNGKLDSARVQFAQFWHPLPVEQLKVLAEVSSTPSYRAWLWKQVADRTSDREQQIDYYSNAIGFLDQSSQTDPRLSFARSYNADLLSEIGLRLYRLNALKPHLGVIERAVLDHEKTIEARKQLPAFPPGRPNQPAGPPSRTYIPRDPPSIVLCRILLDPEAHLEQALAMLDEPALMSESIPNSADAAMQRLEQSRYINHVSRLFPDRMMDKVLTARNLTFALSGVSGEQLEMALGETAPAKALRLMWRAIPYYRSMDVAYALGTAAAATNHAEARQVFTSVCEWMRSQASQQPFLFSSSSVSPTYPGRWGQVISQTLPDLKQEAQWHALLDYATRNRMLSGTLSLSSITRLPVHSAALDTAVLVADRWPDISQRIARESAAELTKIAEWTIQESSFPFVSLNLSALSYLDPAAAIAIVDKLEQLQKQANANPPSGRPMNNLDVVAPVRATVLRGLLLEPERLLANPIR